MNRNDLSFAAASLLISFRECIIIEYIQKKVSSQKP